MTTPTAPQAPAASPTALRALLPWTSFWAVMGVSFGAAAWATGGEPLSAGVASAMTVANTFLVAIVEQLLPRKAHANLLRDRQSLNDIGHGVLFTFVGRPLAAAVGIAFVAFVSQRFEGLSALWPVGLPLLAQLALALLLLDLANYGFHRALHRVPRLWWFHAVHHDTRQMHLLKSGRLHIGEQVLQFLVVATPLLLLGCPTEVMLWLGLWTVFEGNLAHSNLDQRFPAWLHYVMPNVHLHYVHHAEDPELHDANFGGLPLWDLVFGTFRHPDRNPVEATGLPGDPVPPGFLAQVWFPFRAQRQPPDVSRGAAEAAR